ncbi:MAG: flavodoxin family protein [Synergistaceae bacterium]|jgi:flavodoxin|nr:flavodoxin family protein [Synergistaceae bacterium]
MKTVIIYASTHHENTKKIVEAMADCISADVVDIVRNKEVNLTNYDIIGFASGVYFHTLHESIKKFINEATFDKKHKSFLVCTCGIGYRDYTKGVKKNLAEKGIPCIGSFQCRGYDTFGFFDKIGGIAKGHPNDMDLKNARNFVDNIIKSIQ